MFGSGTFGNGTFGASGSLQSPSGSITLQPAPDGQSERFVGTTSNATSGTYTLSGASGASGAVVGPLAFAVSLDAFDFTVGSLAADTWTPTLTVTGPGGTVVVSGVSPFSIMGVAGGGGVQVVIDCLVGAAAASGAAAAVSNAVTIAASAGSAVAAGATALVSNTATVLASAGAALAAGLSALVSNTATVLASAGAALAAGLSALVSNTATVLANTGSALASGTPALVLNTATVLANAGSALASGAQASVDNTPVLKVIASRAPGDASAAGMFATIIAGRGTIVVAPCRVLIGTGQNQPDIDGTYVMRAGRPTIDADPDASLFYGADLTADLIASDASVVSVVGIALNVTVDVQPFIQGDMVVAMLAMIASDDPDAVYSFTFRFTNTLGEVNDRTIYLRKVEK